jgi:hypothetical protein
VTLLVFVVVLGWVIYGVSWLRNRSDSRSVNSISSFNKHLSVLERTSPARPGGPARSAPASPWGPAVNGGPAYAPLGYRSGPTMTRRQAQERRKHVLFGLICAATVTLLLTVMGGGVFLGLHLVVDLALVAYVSLLVQARKSAAERQMKVRYLPSSLEPTIDLRDGHAPLLLRQPAN